MGTTRTEMQRACARVVNIAPRRTCAGWRWCSSESSSPARDGDAWQRNAMNTGATNYRNNFDRIFSGKPAAPAQSKPTPESRVQELEGVVEKQAKRIEELERKLDAATSTLLCYAVPDKQQKQ